MIFGILFDQPIILTKHITHLTLGRFFDQQIVLTPNVKFLLLNCDNYYINENLPNNIERMVLEREFETRQ